MTCTWVSRLGDRTWPCTGHDDGAHNFGDGRRLPLAVTAVPCPPLQPAGPERSADVREFLAARGLGR
jgi:hypothetical protein